MVTKDDLDKLTAKIITLAKIQMGANDHIAELMSNKYVAYDKKQALELVRLNNTHIDFIIKELVKDIDKK